MKYQQRNHDIIQLSELVQAVMSEIGKSYGDETTFVSFDTGIAAVPADDGDSFYVVPVQYGEAPRIQFTLAIPKG